MALWTNTTNTTDSTWGNITIGGGFASSDTVIYRSSYEPPTRDQPEDSCPSELDQLEERVEAVCEKGRL